VLGRSEFWVSKDSVDEELQLMHALMDSFHVRATYTTLFTHRRDVVAWIFTDQDIAEPKKVTVSSTNLEVERESFYEVGDVRFAEYTTFDKLRAK